MAGRGHGLSTPDVVMSEGAKCGRLSGGGSNPSCDGGLSRGGNNINATVPNKKTLQTASKKISIGKYKGHAHYETREKVISGNIYWPFVNTRNLRV